MFGTAVTSGYPGAQQPEMGPNQPASPEKNVDPEMLSSVKGPATLVVKPYDQTELGFNRVEKSCAAD